MAALSSVSVNPTSAQGQRLVRGTVTLTAAAPTGGAVVNMHSSHNDVARAPETVTVPAGATSVSFDITTATVTTRQSVTFTATYSGTNDRATLTVTPPPLVGTFTVTSPTQGADSCRIIEAGASLDCRMQATVVSGFASRYVWTYTLGTDTATHTTADASTTPDLGTAACDFFDTASQGRDANGQRYLEMVMTLRLQDQAGVNGDATLKHIRVYPDSRCGYDF